MSKIIRIGIDIAKHIFYIHGCDMNGKTCLRKKLQRKDLMTFFAQQPPCLVAMESCSGSHFWGRQLRSLGHDVRLITPQFVVPYRKSQKNDYNDAEAICDAAGRDNMRFVAVKSEEQQAALMVHRIREQCVAERTSLSNQIRGHLHEFGFVVPQGTTKIREQVPCIIAQDDFPALARLLLQDLLDAMDILEKRIKTLEQQIQQLNKNSDVANRLMSIKGVGPITASAMVATVGDPRLFKNSRQFAAWLGLVPKQFSSGGKTKLGGITKRGDSYLRKLLIQGARAVMYKASTSTDARSQWIHQLRSRKPDNVVATALAAKLARTIWAMMINGDSYHEFAVS